MGITGYMIRPTTRFMYWHQSTPACMAGRSSEHRFESDLMKSISDESLNALL
jgi:hypothetical protein